MRKTLVTLGFSLVALSLHANIPGSAYFQDQLDGIDSLVFARSMKYMMDRDLASRSNGDPYMARRYGVNTKNGKEFYEFFRRNIQFVFGPSFSPEFCSLEKKGSKSDCVKGNTISIESPTLYRFPGTNMQLWDVTADAIKLGSIRLGIPLSGGGYVEIPTDRRFNALQVVDIEEGFQKEASIAKIVSEVIGYSSLANDLYQSDDSYKPCLSFETQVCQISESGFYTVKSNLLYSYLMTCRLCSEDESLNLSMKYLFMQSLMHKQKVSEDERKAFFKLYYSSKDLIEGDGIDMTFIKKRYLDLLKSK